LQYTGLYADKAGESHFEDITPRFKPAFFAPPAPPLDISEFGRAESCSIIRANEGWYGDWHPAPFRQLHFYLSGMVEAETSDGETRRFGSGDIILVEDTAGQGHRSQVIGSGDVLIAIVKLAGTKQ